MTTRMFEEGANDMEITISVSKEAENILAEKASVQGKDIKTLVEGMITTAARVALAIRDIACVTKHVALAIGQLLWVRNKKYGV